MTSTDTDYAKVNLEAIRRAGERLEGKLIRTPLRESRNLSMKLGLPIHLKLENFQLTGSFKVRGAYNKILTMSAGERERGLVTGSSGNHARAMAWVGRELGVSVSVVMADDAAGYKVEAARSLGARIVSCRPGIDARNRTVAELAREEGLTAVGSFNDPEIINGQGTIGLEIAEQLSSVGTVLVPVSGGGLTSGIATALKVLKPDVAVIAVQSEGNPAMSLSFKAGRPLQVDKVETIADGLVVDRPGDLTFRIIMERVDDVLLVSNQEIVEAMAALLQEDKLLVEPAGCVGVAALMSGKLTGANGPAVAVLSGGNIGLDRLQKLLRPVHETI